VLLYCGTVWLAFIISAGRNTKTGLLLMLTVADPLREWLPTETESADNHYSTYLQCKDSQRWIISRSFAYGASRKTLRGLLLTAGCRAHRATPHCDRICAGCSGITQITIARLARRFSFSCWRCATIQLATRSIFSNDSGRLWSVRAGQPVAVIQLRLHSNCAA